MAAPEPTTTGSRFKAPAATADPFPMGVLAFLLYVAIAAVIVGIVGIRRRDREHRLMRLCADAGLEFSAVDRFVDTTMLPFPLFSAAHSSGVRNVVWDREDDGLVRVFDHSFPAASGESISVGVAITCAIVTLPFNVPPIDIGLRGVRLWPTPPDGERVTLELDAFNERFDVRSHDARAATAFLDQRMMRALLRLPLRVEVHVREDRMLCVAKELEPAEVLVMLQSARELRHRLPPVMKSLYPPRPTEGPFEDRWLQGSWSPDPTAAEPNPADLGG